MIDTNKAMRFMANNFLETGYASLTYTSAAPGYSFADCLDSKQRTKVFKFGGRFLIEAGVNDKIYLNGNTYVVPAADYPTAAALIASINSAIGGSVLFTYTGNEFVITGSTGPVTINTSQVTEAIWETIGFTTGADLGPFIAGQQTQANMVRIHWPYEEVEVDFGYNAQIGFIGMITDLAEEFKMPLGAEITILGNTVYDFTAPSLNQTIPVYKTGAFKFIDDIDDSVWRYVKIRIKCPTASAHPEMGYFYVGDYSTLPERNISTGFESTYDDNSLLSRADEGQIYANDRMPVRVYSSLDVGVSRPEVGAFLKNLYKKKQLSIPFFVALDPLSYLSDSFDEHLALVRFTNPPKHKHVIRNLFEISFELREAI
jgi:hypothetical protein